MLRGEIKSLFLNMLIFVMPASHPVKMSCDSYAFLELRYLGGEIQIVFTVVELGKGILRRRIDLAALAF